MRMQYIALCVLSVITVNNASPTSLFQGAAYSAPVRRQRNKNWCAFIVQKNVSCAVQGSVGSFVEPGVVPCPPHQPDCHQPAMYHTRLRPTYRIAYKAVTELEWRCCPGYQGPDCREVKGHQGRQSILEPQSDTHIQSGFHRYPQRPERRDLPFHDGRRTGVDKARLLEGEVQKLSQAVQDLQVSMAGMSDNLRTSLQEDTSKMLHTLLDSMRPPDSATAGATEEESRPGLLDGHLAVRGHVEEHRGMEEVMARLDGMADALRIKDEALEELRGTLSGQRDQIRLLMDSSQGPPVVQVGDAGGAPSLDLDVLQTYIDKKFERLKKDLTDDIEEKMTHFKSTCDSRMSSVEATCQNEHRNIYTTLTDQIGSKHDDLKKEISSLRLDFGVADGPIPFNRDTGSLRQDDDDDHNDLRREIQRVADAHRILNARMDNELEHLSMLQLDDLFGPRIEELEDRMNVSERNAELHSMFVEDRLSKTISDEVASLRQLLEDRLNGMEDQFTTMLVEISNSSLAGAPSDSKDPLQSQINTNKLLIQTLDDKLNAVAEVCHSKDCKPSFGSLDGVLKDVRRNKNDIEVVSIDVSQNADKITQLERALDRLSAQHIVLTKNNQNLQNKINMSTNTVDHLTDDFADLRDSVNKLMQGYHDLNTSCCKSRQETQVFTSTQGHSLHQVPTPDGDPIQVLQNWLMRVSAQVTTGLSRCNDSVGHVNESVVVLNSKMSDLEKICAKAASASAGGVTVGKDRDPTLKPTPGLLDPIRLINSTVRSNSLDIRNLQRTLYNVQTQVTSLAKHILKDGTAKEQGSVRPQRPIADPSIQVPPRQPQINQIQIIPNRLPTQPRQPTIAIPHLPGLQRQPQQHGHGHRQPQQPRPGHHQQPQQPQQPTQRHRQPVISWPQPSSPLQPPQQPLAPRRPVLETGEAGPPGYQRRVTVRRDQGSDASYKPFVGFAGAPGYPPPVRPVAFQTNPFAVSQTPYKHVAHAPVVTPVADQSPDAMVEPVSFSAGLTSQTLSGDFSIIRFNRVLVNDGDHYNPHTGIFTVPMDGRYLVTGVLEAQRGERLEAVLSVSNRSVQKLDTTGYGQGDMPWGSTDNGKCVCGGTASFSIVLPLRRGDRVGVVRTSGKLAVSESMEMLSTFSAIFLYSPQSSR